jgi:hypothetical protein
MFKAMIYETLAPLYEKERRGTRVAWCTALFTASSTSQASGVSR